MITQEQLQQMLDICEAHPSKFRISKNYSGRGMFGANCVSISTDHRDSDYSLCGELYAIGVPPGRTDSMGLGTVYYWPSTQWPEDLPFPTDDEDDDYNDEEYA
jgi:hypothetical protein